MEISITRINNISSIEIRIAGDRDSKIESIEASGVSRCLLQAISNLIEEPIDFILNWCYIDDSGILIYEPNYRYRIKLASDHAIVVMRGSLDQAIIKEIESMSYSDERMSVATKLVIAPILDVSLKHESMIRLIPYNETAKMNKLDIQLIDYLMKRKLSSETKPSVSQTHTKEEPLKSKSSFSFARDMRPNSFPGYSLSSYRANQTSRNSSSVQALFDRHQYAFRDIKKSNVVNSHTLETNHFTRSNASPCIPLQASARNTASKHSEAGTLGSHSDLKPIKIVRSTDLEHAAMSNREALDVACRKEHAAAHIRSPQSMSYSAATDAEALDVACRKEHALDNRSRISPKANTLDISLENRNKETSMSAISLESFIYETNPSVIIKERLYWLMEYEVGADNRFSFHFSEGDETHDSRKQTLRELHITNGSSRYHTPLPLAKMFALFSNEDDISFQGFEISLNERSIVPLIYAREEAINRLENWLKHKLKEYEYW